MTMHPARPTEMEKSNLNYADPSKEERGEGGRKGKERRERGREGRRRETERGREEK